MSSLPEHQFRYLPNAEAYLAHILAAFGEQFASLAELNSYFSGLNSDAVRDEFLRVGSFYRLLVKDGDWVSRLGEDQQVVDYLTETYKLVALFSLIESISGERHQPFDEWLKLKGSWPIPSAEALDALHNEYKATYGSIRRCLWFFQQMEQKRQNALCRAIRINGRSVESIEQVAKFLYQLRSSFVHEGSLVLELSSTTVVSSARKKILICEITLQDLKSAFEECLIVIFRDRIDN